MRRALRWLMLIGLASGTLGGAATAWRLEGSVAQTRDGEGVARVQTPVLSVRRVPTVLAAPVAERRLYADLDAVVPLLPVDSCLVVEGPRIRYDHRGDVPLVPASTIKLLTATAALVALGPDAHLRTTVVAGAPPEGGVVRGDLTLVGGGDPLLATADYMSRFQRQPQLFTDLDGLVAAIVSGGIRRIEGSVVGDEARYDAQRYGPTWPARYIEQGSTGPLSALAVNDGFARYPTKDDRGVPLEAAADPAANAAAVLTRRLEASGVSVAGPPRSGRAPAGAVEVAGVASPSVAEVVGQLLRESDNDTGEMLLKEVGRTEGQPTSAGGAARLRALLDDGAVDLDGLQVIDGSGLAVENRVTCDLLVDVLGRPGTGAVIQERLAVAGESGTLERRFAGTPLAGVLRAKTGSLRSVSALAGLVADDDPALTFAVLVNVPEGTTVPRAVDGVEAQVAEVLATWPRTPDVAVLGPQGGAG